MDKLQPILPEQLDEAERYLLHQMLPEEEQAFAEKLSLNSALKKSVGELQIMLLGIQESALAQKLDSFHKSPQQKQPVFTKKTATVFSLQRLLLAASVIGIMVLGAWFAWFKKSETESLFASYFKPDTGLLTAMSSTGNYAFDKAMVDYKTGNYDAAIIAWAKLQATQPANDTISYFLGAAHLAANDAGKAITYFQEVIAIPASSFFYDANWYLGLCYLKEKNIKEAMASIRKSNHPRKYALLAKLMQ